MIIEIKFLGSYLTGAQETGSDIHQQEMQEKKQLAWKTSGYNSEMMIRSCHFSIALKFPKSS